MLRQRGGGGWAEMGGADLGLTSPGGNLVFTHIAKGSFFEKLFEGI